jgi:hypothetical protein
MKCYTCQEEGHRSSECPNGRLGKNMRSRSRSRENDRGINKKVLTGTKEEKEVTDY